MTAEVPRARIVLAVDPGRGKCGVAVCSTQGVLARTIVARPGLPALIADWQRRFAVTEIVVGDRTGARDALAAARGVATVPVVLIGEAGTTLAARARYLREHPPRGWRRLLPRGMRTPPEPYDDYVAVLLAEAALAKPARVEPGQGPEHPS
ncbi:MAG: pre-16S rRNA-processing nuclease YqgF [Armatimonadota bacterium]|nr:pre-16S rRNA-processing nuclease YqgF [Armatimonadota bacterium]